MQPGEKQLGEMQLGEMQLGEMQLSPRNNNLRVNKEISGLYIHDIINRMLSREYIYYIYTRGSCITPIFHVIYINLWL